MKYTLQVAAALGILAVSVAVAEWLSRGDGGQAVTIWLLEIALLTIYGLMRTYVPRTPRD